ncbi:hypothetical protein AB0B63_21065 [Micromonospora sp. NPDC049081]|uniref:hypothetical protein n=1 Tax=Micromonospora sp. NPDC049081 TaxID=3155150 RepID=UPI0034111711
MRLFCLARHGEQEGRSADGGRCARVAGDAGRPDRGAGVGVQGGGEYRVWVAGPAATVAR